MATTKKNRDRLIRTFQTRVTPPPAHTKRQQRFVKRGKETISTDLLSQAGPGFAKRHPYLGGPFGIPERGRTAVPIQSRPKQTGATVRRPRKRVTY